MPKMNLEQVFADNPPLPEKGNKTNYFDTQITGLLLEVRKTGKATYYLRYRDEYRRIKHRRIGPADGVSLHEARTKAQEIKAENALKQRSAVTKEKSDDIPTLQQFVDEHYLAFAKMYKRSWRLEELMLRKRILPRWGPMRLSEITRGFILQFQSDFLQEGYKPATVNRSMALIKFIFNLAEKWEIIEKSPVWGVMQLHENNQKERYLSQEELNRLMVALKVCKSTVVPDLIEFLILTGARKGEAAHARWEDVDLQKCTWKVPLSKSGKARYIPLSNAAVTVLLRRKREEGPYIFPSPKTGKPITNFYTTWYKIRTNAGLPDLRVHDLRHNFASLLINAGRSLYEVQKLLGHANITTTQRYAHLSQDTLKEATEVASLSVYDKTSLK